MNIFLNIAHHKPCRYENHHDGYYLLVDFVFYLPDEFHCDEVPNYHGGSDVETVEKDAATHQVELSIDDDFYDVHGNGRGGFGGNVTPT